MYLQLFDQLATMLVSHLKKPCQENPDFDDHPDTTRSCIQLSPFSQFPSNLKQRRFSKSVSAKKIPLTFQQSPHNQITSQNHKGNINRKRDCPSARQMSRQSFSHCISIARRKYSSENHSVNLNSAFHNYQMKNTKIPEKCIFCKKEPCDQRLACSHSTHFSCFEKSPKNPKCSKCESKNDYRQ